MRVDHKAIALVYLGRSNLVSSMIGDEDVVRRVLPLMNLTALWKGPTSASPKLP